MSLVTVLSFGQEFSYPVVNQSGKSIDDLFPTGWTILNTATGDLNRDKLSDVVMILQHKDSVSIVKPGNSEDTVLTQPRILVILFKDSSGNKLWIEL